MMSSPKNKKNKPYDEVLGAAQFTERTMSKVVKSCQKLSKVVKSCQKLSKAVKSCHLITVAYDSLPMTAFNSLLTTADDS